MIIFSVLIIMKLKISFVDAIVKIINDVIRPTDHISRKYTEKEYVTEIINFFRNSIYWRRHNGLINGRVLNNKHHQYIQYDIYKIFYKSLLDRYFLSNKTSKLKYQIIDSTFINN